MAFVSSKRIEAIVDMAENCRTIADIGTDHGFISKRLLEEGKAENIIATDISAPSLRKAENLLRDSVFSCRIVFRVGNGLQVISPGEADGIVIAGMGGQLILKILGASPEVVGKADWMIISPQKNIYDVRRMLTDLGLHIEKERIVEEDRRFYDHMFIRNGASEPYSEEELLTGRLSLTEDRDAFMKMAAHRIRSLERILKKVTDGDDRISVARELSIWKKVYTEE